MENLIKTVLTISKELNHLKRKQEILEDKVNNPIIGKYIDTKGVKKALKLSDKGIYHMRKKGALPFTYINGKLLYKTDDIIKILEQNNSRRKENHEN